MSWMSARSGTVPIARAAGWLALLLLLCVQAAFFSKDAAAQQVSLRGFVVDHEDRQTLVGVNVTLQDEQAHIRGTATSKDGYYQISRIPPGRYVVNFSFVGYAAFRDTLDLGADLLVTLNVALRPDEEALEEVVIEAERGAAQQAGLQTARPRDLARIPTPDASGDLASYLQSLPGVVTLGDRGGQLFIRGGTPAQNLVLVDGLLIYQPFHVIGFFSAFPQDLVSHVDAYAGGFGARYNGRISSVIDVTTRDGNKLAYAGQASLSPFITGVQAEGPLKPGKISFLTSLRTSAIERTAPVFLGRDLPFAFNDTFVKLHLTDQDKYRCSISSVHTYDRGSMDPADEPSRDIFRWSNFVAGGRCLTLPSTSKTAVDLSTGVSYVNNAFGDIRDPERTSYSLLANTELNFTSYPRRFSRVDWGMFVRMNWLGYTLEQFQNLESSDALVFDVGAYAEATYTLADRLSLTPGLSFRFAPAAGTFSAEPRFRMAWRPDGRASTQQFNVAAGIYRQALEGISDERDAGSVFIAWVPAPLGVQARALHALAGWQKQVGSWFSFQTEGYYKRISNLPVPIWSTLARFTTSLALAYGNLYGFDTRAELNRAPVHLSLGYGFSRTEYLASQGNFSLWFGEPVQRYTPPHDRRHQVHVVASIDLPLFTAGVHWQFGTGLPYTRIFGFDEFIPLQTLYDVRRQPGIRRVLFDRPFDGRLPAYHRLDISIERTISFEAARLTVQGGAINLYDRANLFYYDVFTFRRINQLPMIPYISLKVETR